MDTQRTGSLSARGTSGQIRESSKREKPLPLRLGGAYVQPILTEKTTKTSGTWTNLLEGVLLVGVGAVLNMVSLREYQG